MPWTNYGINGQLAPGSTNPNAAFYRSLGLNDDGTGPATGPATPAAPLPTAIPTTTVGGANRPAPPAAPALAPPPTPNGSFVPPTAAPTDPAGAVYPARDVNAFQRYLQGNGGYMPPSMAVAAAPGQMAPDGARALTTEDGGRFFVDAAANPLSPRGGPGQIATGIPGVNMPTFEQFRWQNINSGIGANTPALMQAYMRMQGGLAGVENQRGQTANAATETNARFGPNGLAQQELQIRQGTLALDAAQAQLRATSWARRAETERGLIAAGMTPEAAARRVQEMERSGSFNGPTIDMTQIPGLPGYVPRSPTGPASPLPAAGPAPAAANGRPAAAPTNAPAAQSPGGLIVPPVQTQAPPPGPVFEDLARQVEAQFPTSSPQASTPGALVMRLQQAFPTMFSNTPEGLRNRAAIFPYLNSRFNPMDVERASQGTFMSPFGAIAQSDLSGPTPGLNRLGRFFGSLLLDGGNNMSPDLQGRALLQSMQQGRW